MRRIGFYLLTGALLVGMALAQTSTQTNSSAAEKSSVSAGQSGTQAQSATSATTAQQANAAGSQVQAGNLIYAELTKSIDAKKAKVGDEVVAKTDQAVLSNGKVVAPKGTKILGHVTEVKQHTKDQPQSELGIVFDHMVLKDGNQVPISLSLQAIGSGQTAASSSQNDQDYGMAPMGAPTTGGMSSGHTGMTGGVMGTARSTAGGVANTGGTVAGTATDTLGGAAPGVGVNTRGRMGASSHGVVGLPDLTLSAETANSAQGSLIASNKRNVKLDGGTELVLRVNQQK